MAVLALAATVLWNAPATAHTRMTQPTPRSNSDALKAGGVTDLRKFRWLDAPHVPHAWECGFLFEERTATLLCGDLLTQGGAGDPPLTEADVLGPSEAFRQPLDYFAHAPQTAAILGRLADLQPATLACMHGSAWQGNGQALIRELARSLGQA